MNTSRPTVESRRTERLARGASRAASAVRRVEWLIASLVLAGVVFLGCATIGRDFAYRRVAEIQVDQTTKGEILGRFGLPYRRGIEDGDSTWTYVHYKVRLFGEKLRTRDLYVRFDRNDIVRSFTYNSNMDD